MSIFMNHVIFFYSFILITTFSLIFLIYLVYMSLSFFFLIDLFNLFNLELKVTFMLDWMSVSFSFMVLLISSIIMIYSYNYMMPYNKSIIFLSLTSLFVISMLIVILMNNLFFVMLGWDGLGLISFFLIVFYQNQSSITSGLFTLLMNRLGDCFFLVTLAMLFFNFNTFSSFSSMTLNNLSIFMLILTFMTKSALYPFSPWLPMAMAAPTPISALVHSSTLVTAGLYLMMRYSYILYFSNNLMFILMVVSLFTSFYAGLNSICETDLKKLIALSTLSHLGFIGLAFSSGLLSLSFFHLLVHALFKSLLFMTMGDIMINLNHSQDIRYLSMGSLYTPMSTMIMNICLLNLFGIPNTSGFFSKDLILESFNYSNLSIFMVFMLYFNILFTYYYTFKILYFTFQSSKVTPFQLMHKISLYHSFLMLLLSLITMFFYFYFFTFLNKYILFYPIFISLKFYPFFLVTSFFILLMIFLTVPKFSNHFIVSYFSSMLFLFNLMMTFSSNLYSSMLFNAVKSLEMGFLNNFMNNSLNKFSSNSMNIMFNSKSLMLNYNLNFMLSFFFISVLILII